MYKNILTIESLRGTNLVVALIASRDANVNKGFELGLNVLLLTLQHASVT